MAIGDAIKARRKPRLTQEVLGEKLGVSQALVSQWETGETIPTSDQLVAIAMALETAVEDMVAAGYPAYDRWRRDLIRPTDEVQGAPNLRGADARLEARIRELERQLEAREARLRNMHAVAERLLRGAVGESKRKPARKDRAARKPPAGSGGRRGKPD